MLFRRGIVGHSLQRRRHCREPVVADKTCGDYPSVIDEIYYLCQIIKSSRSQLISSSMNFTSALLVLTTFPLTIYPVSTSTTVFKGPHTAYHGIDTPHLHDTTPSSPISTHEPMPDQLSTWSWGNQNHQARLGHALQDSIHQNIPRRPSTFYRRDQLVASI